MFKGDGPPKGSKRSLWDAEELKDAMDELRLQRSLVVAHLLVKLGGLICQCDLFGGVASFAKRIKISWRPNLMNYSVRWVRSIAGP